jgi:hypothetical protein
MAANAIEAGALPAEVLSSGLNRTARLAGRMPLGRDVAVSEWE